jgi:hypothetical protein
MENLLRIAPVVFIILATACSGGDPSGNTIVPEEPGGSATLAGSFDPAQPSPGDATISMSQGSGSSGDIVLIQINVTGIDNLFGVNFDFVYDPAMADYIGEYHNDSILATGGRSVSCVVTEQQPGVVVGGIAINGGEAGGVDVTTTQELITLAFRVTAAGSSPASFQNESCDDADLQAIPGLTWTGGTLIAN